MEMFKDKDRNTHVIDNGGNHFINGRCVNPLAYMTDEDGNKTINPAKVGSTVPPKGERFPIATGHVDLTKFKQV